MRSISIHFSSAARERFIGSPFYEIGIALIKVQRLAGCKSGVLLHAYDVAVIKTVQAVILRAAAGSIFFTGPKKKKLAFEIASKAVEFCACPHRDVR